MTCRCDLGKFVCKALIWFLSYRTEWHIHHFHMRQKIWKAHLQGYGWNNFHSVVNWQYETSYVYSRYVNACQRRKGDITVGRIRTLHSHLARRIRSWFCCSAPCRVQLPWLSTLLQLCCASRCSFSCANFNVFVFFGACFLCWRLLQSDCKSRNIIPARCTDREGRVVVVEKYSLYASGREEAAYEATTPVMRCSEQRGRTDGILMATIRREDICWGKEGIVKVLRKTL